MTSVIIQSTALLGDEPPALAELGSADLPALLEMLTRCSAATLQRRFHGPSDGVAYLTRVAAGGDASDTVLAWLGEQCVGAATLAGSGDDVELGVLVEDAWQRRGVGTRLVRRLVERARAAGVTVLRADVLGEDRFILRALSRIDDLRVSCESGVYTARVKLGRDTRRARWTATGTR